MKKKIFTIAVIAIVASLAAYGTLAYFTYEDSAENVITTGNVKIALEELSLTDDGELIPFDGAYDVMPGEDVSKIVQVKNTGSQDAWIRISVDKAITLADGITEEADISLITYGVNTDSWTEKDGFYYYSSALKAGETTEPLFKEVHFSAEMGNMYQSSTAVIIVTAQATQVKNNGATVLEAAGWPDAE